MGFATVRGARFSSFSVISLAFLGLWGVPVLCCAAESEATDPIRIDENQWTAPVTPVMPAITASHAQPSLKITVPAVEAPVAAKTVAAPARPVDLPVMPAMTGSIMLKVDSTAEQTQAQIGAGKDGHPDLVLREKGWRDATEEARKEADQIRADNTGGDREPLDVRMSYLPNPKITPISVAATVVHPRVGEVMSTPKPILERKTASCSPELDKERQRQLDAIESDRKTLQALQSAITDLGLQKQLNFMTNASKGVTVDAAQATNQNAATP